MVSASTRPNLIKLVSRFGRSPRDRAPRSALGGVEDAAAALVTLLVEAGDRAHGGRGLAQAQDDLGGLHVVVALPRRVDVDLGAGIGGPLALDDVLLVGLALGLADARRG